MSEWASAPARSSPCGASRDVVHAAAHERLSRRVRRFGTQREPTAVELGA